MASIFPNQFIGKRKLRALEAGNALTLQTGRFQIAKLAE